MGRTDSRNKFGNTGAGNYSEFQNDGTLFFHGDATVWNDLIIYPTALGTAASAPDLIGFGPTGTIQCYAFDGGTISEQLYGSFEMAHDYEEGTDLDVHVHWSPTTNAAGNVKWFMDYTIANIDGTFGANQTISSVNSTTSTAWKHIYSDIADIPGAGLKIGHMVMFRLYRVPTDSQDTYGADAAILSVGVHYKCNSVGSRQELIK